MKLILKEYLQKVGVSIYRLEKETGMHHKTLSDIVNNKTKSISYENLGKICSVLNCTPNDIFEIDKNLK